MEVVPSKYGQNTGAHKVLRYLVHERYAAETANNLVRTFCGVSMDTTVGVVVIVG